MTGFSRIFIGWDSRETVAYDVARQTALARSSVPLDIRPIKLPDLVAQGIYTREVDPLASTEFTYSRFLTPFLADFEGWALFCDCDFLFFGDLGELEGYLDASKAVLCVQHDYRPKDGVKMDGKVQTSYPRKNWSSFMLFNCAHPSTRKLTPELVNRESGAYLHRMAWATDSEIGALPTEWNWLEGWNEMPAEGEPKAVHYTRGGPWFKDWQQVEYADVWRREAAALDPGFTPG
ncbi:glycosyltransferase [Aureimonas leprariae]|uniref:Glycosyltransferase n=1 Tax=Plantimonas leprariae TaxID=2615207 RepID=A0A7V7PT36_9HYPH|nr:glycosyltransferase [Aureimonas leprariae]KAB0682762.1 glycosyltransferase [Aureimonas leprariae]